MNLKAQAFSGIKWTSASTVIGTGLQFLQLGVLARLLSPEDFGLMAMVMVVIGFAQSYSDAGISGALIYRQDTTSQQLSSLYWLNIAIGILIFGAMWFLAPLVVLVYKEPRLQPMLRMLSLTFLIIPFGKQFEILFQKNLCFNVLAKQQISAEAFGTLVAIVSAALGQGVWSLVWGQLAREILRNQMLMVRGLKEYRPAFTFRLVDLKGYLSFGLYQMGERSINFMAERTDQFLIGTLLGAQPLGYYNFAFNLVVQPISRINPIVTKVAFPVFAKLQDDITRLRNGYLKVLNLLTTINAPALFGLAALSPWGIPMIFGAQWHPSVILVQILALVSLLRSTGNPVGSLVLAKGRADRSFKWNVMLFVVTVPAVYIGITLGSVIGVALSLMILQVVFFWPAYLYLVKPLTGPCGLDYLRSIGKPVVMAMAMGCGIWSVSMIYRNSWTMLGAQVVLGVGFYFFLLWIVDRTKLIELVQMVSGASDQRSVKRYKGYFSFIFRNIK